MPNVFRALIYPSSGACDYSVELPPCSNFSCSMCVGVSVRLGWSGMRVAGFSLRDHLIWHQYECGCKLLQKVQIVWLTTVFTKVLLSICCGFEHGPNQHIQCAYYKVRFLVFYLKAPYNIIYIGQTYRQSAEYAFYIFSQQIYVIIFFRVSLTIFVYSPTKYRVFPNVTLFGS